MIIYKGRRLSPSEESAFLSVIANVKAGVIQEDEAETYLDIVSGVRALQRMEAGE